MQFQIGEKVVFLNEKGGGVVRKIENNRVYVEDETGFERPFLIKDLAKIKAIDKIDKNLKLKSNILIDKLIEMENFNKSINLTSKKNSVKKRKNQIEEIDLHIDETDNLKYRNISSQLEFQLKIFKDYFYKAKKRKLKKFIVIHGYGKGILRNELIIFLNGQKGIEFFDAPYIEYGHGAIQVEIKYDY
jgi:DNA-nicking Smr family endonuclease